MPPRPALPWPRIGAAQLEWNFMRSLITGGAGFIGSHVARHCLASGHEVVVVDDLSGGFADQVPPGACFRCGSVADSNFVSALFAVNRFDYIFHLAAYAAEGLSHFIRRFNYVNNLVGSVNLINEAVKQECRCFVFTSSIAVYGAGQVPMREDMTPSPASIRHCEIRRGTRPASRPPHVRPELHRLPAA